MVLPQKRFLKQFYQKVILPVPIITNNNKIKIWLFLVVFVILISANEMRKDNSKTYCKHVFLVADFPKLLNIRSLDLSTPVHPHIRLAKREEKSDLKRISQDSTRSSSTRSISTSTR